MSARKKITVEEYFQKILRKFIDFGVQFADIISDSSYISALAERDLEKLAKVWKLVFEMLGENCSENAAETLSQLIGEYKQLGGDEDE